MREIVLMVMQCKDKYHLYKISMPYIISPNITVTGKGICAPNSSSQTNLLFTTNRPSIDHLYLNLFIVIFFLIILIMLILLVIESCSSIYFIIHHWDNAKEIGPITYTEARRVALNNHKIHTIHYSQTASNSTKYDCQPTQQNQKSVYWRNH